MPVIQVFRRQGVETEKARGHIDGPQITKASGRTQGLDLGLHREPVSRFHLDRGHTLRDQRVEPRQGFGKERILARAPQSLDGGENAATGSRDLRIARALEPHLEFMGPVAGMQDVAVAIDQPGGHPASTTVLDGLRVPEAGGQLRFGSRVQNAATSGNDGGLFDDAETLMMRVQRRQPDVPPEAFCLAAPADVVLVHFYRSLGWILCIYI